MVDSKLEKDFFARDTHLVCQNLLGKFLVREKGKNLKIGRIVEIEAYQGFDDAASHASRKRTSRNEIMFASGGHYYVYMIYGMYYCLNIVTEGKDFPAAILVRAVEPVFDSDHDLSSLSLQEKRILGSGPGRLCRWLEIDKKFNGKSVENGEVYLSCHPEVQPKDLSPSAGQVRILHFVQNDKVETKQAKRIGVHYAGDSAYLDWRYYDAKSIFISKK